jgi:phage shock protein A
MPLGRLLHAFLAPAPDPRDMERAAGSLQPQLLGGVREALGRIAESRDDLALRVVQLRGRLEDLDAEAREALAGGSRDLARHVVARRQIVTSELELLERQLRATNDEVQRLALVEQQLAARIDVLTARRRLMEAREGAAAIQVRVGEALAGLSDDSGRASTATSMTERRTEELEARAAALDELLQGHTAALFEVENTLDELEHGLGGKMEIPIRPGGEVAGADPNVAK